MTIQSNLRTRRAMDASVVILMGSLFSNNSAATDELPPVPLQQLRPQAKMPSWDAGVLLAPCGVGSTAIWQETQFCLGALVDVFWGRESSNEFAYGLYGQVGSAGFNDVRASSGAALLFPFFDFMIIEGRLGGLARVNQESVAPGGELFLEWGTRNFSYSQPYSLSHTLLAGLQWTAPSSSSSASTALWLGVRFDGYWLSAPAMLLQ